MVAAPSAKRGSARRILLWSAVGCLTLILLTAAGSAVLIYKLIQGVKSGAITCVPSNFPRYPGATFASWSYDQNGPFGDCHAVFESPDRAADVAAYYAGKLNSGSWQVTLSDLQNNTVTFESSSGSAPFGIVQAALKNDATEITAELYSAECLLLGFPTYPGAKFGGQSVGASGYGCHVVFLTKDQGSSVIAYYMAQLSRGDWRVESSSSSKVAFRLTSGKRTVASGTVTVGLSIDERTQITVDSYP